MATLIEAKNITCGYHGQPVLHDISCEIFQGEFFGIIGPNGSGKSTFLKCASGCLQPFGGKVYYEYEDIYSIPARELAKRFAFVGQDPGFNFSFSAEEIVAMGRIPYLPRLRAENAQDAQVIKEAMRVTDTLKFSEREINSLSAGERQLVVIARAIAQQPCVLFLDEPTAHLDIGHQVHILNLIKDLSRNRNITVIIVLHDLNLASEYCDRILLFDKGRMRKIGTPEQVLTFDTIEQVYRTLVVVNQNPFTGNPHILLTQKEKA
jgi:iron complex transport system ATP-binding protein